jgi:hypothetical protein
MLERPKDGVSQVSVPACPNVRFQPQTSLERRNLYASPELRPCVPPGAPDVATGHLSATTTQAWDDEQRHRREMTVKLVTYEAALEDSR